MNPIALRKLLGKGFFRLARNTSLYSSHRVKVGAVISKKKPISVGFNIRRTHPVYSNPNDTNKEFIHAEMSALIHCRGDLHGADIYVYRETDDGKPALARPCKMCYNMLKDAGIRKMYYTTPVPPFWNCEDMK